MAGPVIGEPAPDFTLPDQFGRPTSLRDLTDGTAVLLVFFPFAFTPTCQGELEAIETAQLTAAGVRPAAVSCDPVASLKAFGDEVGFTGPLLSDFWPHGAAAREYGVFIEERGFANRGSFLIDRAGVLRWSIITSPSGARAVIDYREAIAALG